VSLVGVGLLDPTELAAATDLVVDAEDLLAGEEGGAFAPATP
jgi:hypothetical protein